MKHAFLIMAHSNWKLLKRIINSLDFEDSRIYLHIDAKSVISQAELEEMEHMCYKADFVTIPRIKVTWGGYSQIQCELNLLRAAAQEHSDYYHLLSGNDYLIPSEAAFKAFFDQNKGKEFIGFTELGEVSCKQYRLGTYRFLQECIGRNSGFFNEFLRKIESGSMWLQGKVFRIDRTKKYNHLILAKGANWCSLTDPCVRYILKQEKLIRKMFRYTMCCDELFAQTVIANSPFMAQVYQTADVQEGVVTDASNVRAIDWNRGKPYTFEKNDYEPLVTSGNMFVRKVNDDTPEHAALLDLLDEWRKRGEGDRIF